MKKKREKIVEIKLSSTGPAPARPCPTPNTGPNGASPSFADAEGQTPDPPETVTHWQWHYPWDLVTPMALNSRGEQIYYRTKSDQDRMPVCQWAWRMERAVDHHMALRERDGWHPFLMAAAIERIQ